MCGIFGVLKHGSDQTPPEALLRDTAARMTHRGPDGHGIHAVPGFALVHTRLSLVDLNERSAQPFHDRSGRYTLVYNGELYDYDGLRAELEQRGVVFRTTSDTEVLLESLIAFGVEETLRRIEGMFAFGLHDAADGSLVLARDRFGIKPLFVYEDDATFLFASAVDAMRPWVRLAPDPLMVPAYLQGFNGPTSGRSFYDRVRIVPPGAVVRIGRGERARFTQCLDMHDLVDPDMRESFAGRPRSELVDHVEQLLLQSVRSQLCADVPVGAFCSGGVDSSLIMAMATRSHQDLRVFHADIVGPLSERGAAERLSRHLGLDMQAVEVRDAHFVDLLPDVVAHFGAPFVNPTLIPVMMVSALVNRHGTKAVLTGEASDECFLGYEWLAPDLRASLRRLPGKLLRRIGIGGASAAPGSRDAELSGGLAHGYEIAVGPVECGDAQPRPYHVPGTRGLASDPNLSYILRTLLYRNDTMGMAASVESRFPFLDTRVVQASVNLPYDCKIRFSPLTWDDKHPFYRDKWIVREIAARYLPPELSHRQKGMFPTNAFQRMQVEDAFFDGGFVADWFALPRARMARLLAGASRSLRLRLMLLECWAHVCVLDLPRARLAARLGAAVRVAPL